MGRVGSINNAGRQQWVIVGAMSQEGFWPIAISDWITESITSPYSASFRVAWWPLCGRCKRQATPSSASHIIWTPGVDSKEIWLGKDHSSKSNRFIVVVISAKQAPKRCRRVNSYQKRRSMQTFLPIFWRVTDVKSSCGRLRNHSPGRLRNHAR